MDLMWQMVLSLNYETKGGNESAHLQKIWARGVEGRAWATKESEGGVLSAGQWLFLRVAGVLE